MMMHLWKPTRERLQDAQGFTLIEALIAMALFSVGVLAVATMQYRTVRNTSVGNVKTHALMLAYASLEQLKNTSDLTTLTMGLTTETDLDEMGETGTGGSFIRDTNVMAGVGSGGLPNRLIQVTIRHPQLGLWHQVRVETVTQGGGV